jgi:RNA polymerase sigma-70 factor, ECF subfamily
MDLSQFNAQIMPLRDKLYRLALRITGSGATAEDIVQDVFEKIWRKKDDDQLAQTINWEAMSMTMTRNKSLDQTRSKRHQVMSVMPDTFDAPDTTETDQDMIYTEQTTNVAALVMQLPEKQRTVLHLREVEDMSYDDIADALQISLDDVKVNLHRARKYLRERLTATRSS